VQERVPSIAGNRKDMHAYICGLTKMVKTNRDLLYSLGWDSKSVLYERYD
jgi:ferredoxin-NADP reductase